MKKKLLVMVLTLCLAIAAMTVMAFADDDWVVDDGTLTISSDFGMDDWLQNGYRNCSDFVESVVINSGVTYIGDNAFYNCTNLESVSIPDTVTTIGEGAFRNCTSLTSITIPDSVTSIGSRAFFSCTNLTSITIPDGVVTIGAFAFFECTSLTSVTIPSSVATIGKYAFAGCKFESIEFEDGINLTTIDTNVFYACASLTSITIPSSVTSIGNASFQGCTSLTSITIPSSVQTIGANAFYNCTGLGTVTIESCATIIGTDAFYNTPALTNGNINQASHTYDNGVVTTVATCTEAGEMTYTCSVCRETYTAEIPATGHSTEIQNAKDATCTEDGYTGDEACTVCGETVTAGEVIPATGHTTEIQNAKDATCTEDGYTGDELCTVCHETITFGTVIAATGNHTYDAGVVRKEVTCTEDGYITYTCLVCGDSYTEEIQATGHSYDQGSVAKDATCDTPGSKIYTCTVCGDSYTEVIAATGHAWGETAYTWNEDGSSCTATHTCENDSSHVEEATATIISGQTLDPTCTEKGETTYMATFSEYWAEAQTLTVADVDATGHSYIDSYVWDDDFTSCTVTLICENCSSVVQYFSATDDEVTITEVDGLFTVTLIHDEKTYSTSVQTYTVTWVDGNGNEVQVDSRLLKDETVEYTGSTPTKASDDKYSYTFAGWDKTIEAVSGNTIYTATFTASAHNYTASFTWADDLKSATVTLNCSDCDHTVTIDSLDVTIKAVNNLGLVTRTATAELNGVTYTDSVTTGTSLLVISADYTAVNLAIARANGLDASNYSNFDTVTVAINSVQWGLNVLNQATVTAYADAINTAIDNLVETTANITEETVNIDEPIEDTNTDTEDDDEELSETSEPESNPTTGIAFSILPMMIAALVAASSKRR